MSPGHPQPLALFLGGGCVSLFTPPAQAGGQDESPGGRGRGEGRQQ